MTNPGSVIDEIVFKLELEHGRIIEEHLRVIVQPKPRWLPYFIWSRLLARVLYLQSSWGIDT